MVVVVAVVEKRLKVAYAIFAGSFEKALALPENGIVAITVANADAIAAGSSRAKLLSLAAGVDDAGVDVVAHDTYRVRSYFVLFQGLYQRENNIPVAAAGFDKEDPCRVAIGFVVAGVPTAI